MQQLLSPVISDLIMGDNTLVAEYINSDQLAEVDDVLENIDFKENALRYATFNDQELPCSTFLYSTRYVHQKR